MKPLTNDQINEILVTDFRNAYVPSTGAFERELWSTEDKIMIRCDITAYGNNDFDVFLHEVWMSGDEPSSITDQQADKIGEYLESIMEIY